MLRELPPSFVRIKSVAKPRSMHRIIATLLEVCEQRTKRTHVIYKVNLSHSMLLEYVELAIKNGLIEEMPDDRSLLTTEKGRAYLEHFSIVERLLTAGLNSNDDNNSRDGDHSKKEQEETDYYSRKIFLRMTP